MKIIQSRSFEHKIKKFSKTEKAILDKEIHKIFVNPKAGQVKKGELKDVYVYKFKIKSIQYLLAYRIVNNIFELIMIGPYENYYKDLKYFKKNR